MKNESYQFTAQILWLPQIAQKGQKGLKMTAKSKHLKIQKKILQKESDLFIRTKPQTNFGSHLNPKHSPIEPKKAENDKKSKVWKQKTIENESYQFKVANPKKLLWPHPNTKIITIGS